MKPMYEINDFVKVKMDMFNGFTGLITEVKSGNIFTVHVYGSLDHSEFDIYAMSNELEYINHYDNNKIKKEK